MSTANLYTPAQPTDSAAHHAEASTTAGGQGQDEQKTVLMSWAQWAATPRDYRLTSLYGRPGRWVMRGGPHGVTLYPVHITG